MKRARARVWCPGLLVYPASRERPTTASQAARYRAEVIDRLATALYETKTITGKPENCGRGTQHEVPGTAC